MTIGAGKGAREASGFPAGLYAGPAAIYLLLLFVLPLAMVGAYSFVDEVEGGITLQNYRRAFDPLYLGVLGRSIRLALVTTAITLVVAYPCVLSVRGLPPRTRTIALALLVLPSWLNLLVKNYAWIVILRREGVLNSLLVRLGIVSEPLSMLFTEGAVLVGLVHTFLPFMVLPLYAAVDRLDWSLVEAARDLGAGTAQTFRSVVLPATRVGAFVGCILVFVPTLGAFVTPDLLGGTGSLMIANVIESQVLLVRDWPLAAALAMLVVVLVLLALWPLGRMSRSVEREMG